MSRPFRFKKFEVTQDCAPMKVGTDGVLLGAWCNANQAKNALDIGTGTGLIALMLAQRYQDLTITALEPNTDAFSDACKNIKHSDWSARIQAENLALADFSPRESFDLIVSNPPFFHKDLKNPDHGKTMARHAGEFDSSALLATSTWLSEIGILAGIYPTEVFEDMHAKVFEYGLHLHRACYVKPTPEKAPHRVLFSYAKSPIDSAELKELVIETDGRHQYSDAYKLLTQDFYLKF